MTTNEQTQNTPAVTVNDWHARGLITDQERDWLNKTIQQQGSPVPAVAYMLAGKDQPEEMSA